MNLDKNLIRQWAYLFESEESMRKGDESYLTEDDDNGSLKELTFRMVREMLPENATEFEIPDGVNIIGDQACYGLKRLKRVTIPDGVNIIGYAAFGKCFGLESVMIPDSVTNIGGYAFDECRRLKNIMFPDKIWSIGNRAFRACSSLKNITIPENINYIGEFAFRDCDNLTSVTIQGDVRTEIGYGAFDTHIKELIFKSKTKDEVKRMKNYPWGIYNPESVIKCKT